MPGAPAGVAPAISGTVAAPRTTCTATEAGIVAVMVVTRTHVTTTGTALAAWTVTVKRVGGRMWSSPAAFSISRPLSRSTPLPVSVMVPASGTAPACAPVTGSAPLNPTAEVPAGNGPPRAAPGDESVTMSVEPTVSGPASCSRIGIRVVRFTERAPEVTVQV